MLLRVVAGSVRQLRAVGLRHRSATSSRIYDHYFDHFARCLDYKTVARSNVKLEKDLSDTSFSKLNPASLCDGELVEAVLLCGNPTFARENLKLLDEECRRRLPKLRFDLSVQLMHAWWMAVANEAFKGEYFNSAVAYWPLHLKFATKLEFVHLVYLLGQNKMNPKDLSNILRARFNVFLPSFTPKELAIVCNGFFKLKSGISDPAVLDLVARQAEKLMTSTKDRFDLVAILKFFRLSQYYNKEFLTKLSDYAVSHCGSFNVTECAHFLAAYSCVNVYEQNVFCNVTSRAFSCLKLALEGSAPTDFRAHPADVPRVKDVAKLLWALANVGHEIHEEHSATSVRFIKANLSPNVITHVVDALQSLVCLGVYPRDLIRQVCSSGTERKLARMSKRKPLQQFIFVRNSASIMLGSSTEIAPWTGIDTWQLERRSLTDFINAYSAEGLFPSHVLPHIRIAGVTLSVRSKPLSVEVVNGPLSEKAVDLQVSRRLLESIAGRGGSQWDSKETQSPRTFVSIEVLDESVLVRGSSTQLLGIMKAKLRQLKQLGIKVVLLTPDFVETICQWPEKRRTEWLNSSLRDCVRSPNDEIFYGSQS